MLQCRRPVGELGRHVAEKMNHHHAQLWAWCLGYLGVVPDAHILDIGCGSGRVVDILTQKASSGKVFGIDYSADMVDVSRQANADRVASGQVSIVEGNVAELPFEDESFDTVTAFETIYFWPDPANDLKEVRRVLRPGGQLLIGNEMYDAPAFRERNERCTKLLNMLLWTPDQLSDLVTEAGFSIAQCETKEEKNWLVVVAEKLR